MHLTRACDYAFRAMVYLARQTGQPVETAKVAQEIDVPQVYLRKILQSLSHGGLVRTAAGSGGGVVLAAIPGEVTLKSIIEAVEGPITISDCINHNSACERSAACKINISLAGVQESIRREFSSRTLADIM